MTGKVLLLTVLLAVGALAQFNPTLTVDSCTKSSLVLTLTDAADNGIIYVQGQGAACQQITASGTNAHTIDFNACGITWEETFKIVVQKKSLYQTGDDKQIPIMCIADLGDLTVDSTLDAADKDDDAGQNLTVKPTATMDLQKDGSTISGQTVKLTDIITMILKLDTEYIQDFDIKAKTCTASTIPIITDSCAADIDLFPHVGKVQQGELFAQFGAFRTTSLAGGSVSMPFSCTLQVCLGTCPTTTCNDGATSYGRKKRGIEKRQAEGQAIEDISVGSSISITTDEVVIEEAADNGELCMNQGLFVAIIILMVGGLVASSVVAVYMFKKMQEKSTILNKLNTGGQMGSMSVPIA